MLYEEMTVVYCKNHTKLTTAMCGQNIELLALDLPVNKLTTKI
jgi:hypothetical protein